MAAQTTGLSALLTTTMSAIAGTIRVPKRNGMQKQVKVVIRGAPVDTAFHRPGRRRHVL